MDLLDLADVIRAALDQRLAAVHVSIPATVVTYDAATNTCTARPSLRRVVPTGVDGLYQSEALPDIYGVRVAWPAGGGSSLVLTLVAGDPVELIFSDTDPSTARATGEISDPADVRRHSLAHAWAIPGGGSAAQAIANGPRLVLGGTGDAAALASRVKSLETAFNNHIHTSGGSGSPTTTPTVTSNLTFGSTRIKVDA